MAERTAIDKLTFARRFGSKQDAGTAGIRGTEQINIRIADKPHCRRGFYPHLVQGHLHGICCRLITWRVCGADHATEKTLPTESFDLFSQKAPGLVAHDPHRDRKLRKPLQTGFCPLQAPETLQMPPLYGLLPVALALGAAILAYRALALNAGERNPAAFLAAAAAMALLAALSLLPIVLALPDITAHANAAVSLALLCYCMVHAGLAMLISAHAWWRHRQGYVSARRATDLRLALIWQVYAAAAMLAGVAMVFFLATQGGAG